MKWKKRMPLPDVDVGGSRVLINRMLFSLMLLLLVGAGCTEEASSKAPALAFQVVDTDFSKGRLGYRQEVTLDDLVRLHGHLCDGLIEGTLAMRYGLHHLYPDGVIDRTNTRVVSRSSPCLADAALFLSGARYQYGTFLVSDDIPALYVIGKVNQEEALLIRRKDGVKPAVIDALGAIAIAGRLSPCGLDSLRKLEEDYLAFLMAAEDEDALFAAEKVDSFNWSLPLRNDFIKTDILNKDAPFCE